MPCRKKRKSDKLSHPSTRPGQAELRPPARALAAPVPHPVPPHSAARCLLGTHSPPPQRKQCRCSSRCSPFPWLMGQGEGRESEMILIKCFLSRNKRALSVWNEGSRPYHKRQRQIFISEQKVSVAAYSGGEIFPSLLVKTFNGVRCVSQLLVEVLCFPVRSTNGTVFLSVSAQRDPWSEQHRMAAPAVPALTLCFTKIFSVFQDNGLGGLVLFGFSFCEEKKKMVILSVCLFVCFDAASGPALLLQKGEQSLNRSAPSLAERCSVCCQVNQLEVLLSACLPACLFCRLIFKHSGWWALRSPAGCLSWEWEGGNTAVCVTPNSVFALFPWIRREAALRTYSHWSLCGFTYACPQWKVILVDRRTLRALTFMSIYPKELGHQLPAKSNQKV